MWEVDFGEFRVVFETVAGGDTAEEDVFAGGGEEEGEF